MRRLAVLMLLMTGCGPKPDPQADRRPDPPPVVVPQPPKEEQVAPAVAPDPPYHEAEKGPLRVGGVSVEVARAFWDKYEKAVDVVHVGLVIKVPADSTGTRVVKGWAYDADLIRSLVGKNLTEGGHPLPVTFSAKTDHGEACRGIMRSIASVSNPRATEVTVREMKAAAGSSYYWILTFERPSPNAKKLLIELDAADIGEAGRIRLSIPSQSEWKPTT